MPRDVEGTGRRPRDCGEKRGGGRVRLDLHIGEIASCEKPDETVALNEVLDLLEQADSFAAQVVKLRFFAGLSLPQIAASLGVSLRTVERNWTYARTCLRGALDEGAAKREF